MPQRKMKAGPKMDYKLQDKRKTWANESFAKDIGTRLAELTIREHILSDMITHNVKNKTHVREVTAEHIEVVREIEICEYALEQGISL